MIDLERDSMTPMYEQLAEALRERIRTGAIPLGRSIPSISQLEEETGGEISRRTIRSAVDVLRAEGVVQGVSGKGVFVIAVPPAPEA